MRLPFLLCLALAACSSNDPPLPPPDGGQDVSAVEAGGCTPACSTGYFCQGTRCVGEGDLGPVDTGVDATDTGVDAGSPVDVLQVDVTEDRAGDVGAGCSSDAPVPCPCGFTTGYRACNVDGTFGTCVCSAGDAGSDVPADARIVCTNDDVRCTTNEECQAVCLGYPPGSGFVEWCCPGRHHCIPTGDPRGCGPYLNP